MFQPDGTLNYVYVPRAPRPAGRTALSEMAGAAHLRTQTALGNAHF